MFFAADATEKLVQIVENADVVVSCDLPVICDDDMTICGTVRSCGLPYLNSSTTANVRSPYGTCPRVLFFNQVELLTCDRMVRRRERAPNDSGCWQL